MWWPRNTCLRCGCLVLWLWSLIVSTVSMNGFQCLCSQTSVKWAICVLSLLQDAFAKWRKVTAHVVGSVRPRETTRLPLDRFSLNLIFEYFSKICRPNSSLNKIWLYWWVLYMKTSVHSWYLDDFFWKWEMFQTKVVDEMETHFLCSVTLFPKIVPFMR
jgi:hypothetical protein